MMTKQNIQKKIDKEKIKSELKTKSKKVVAKIFAVVLVAFLSAEVFAQSAVSFYERGQEALSQEDWFSASQNFMEATKLNSSYGQAWIGLAEATYFLGQYELALSYLDKAEKVQRNNNSIHNLRGLTFIALGRTKEARTVFENVLAKSPNDVNARFGLAELDLLDGKLSGAEQLYRQALARQATNRKALLSLAIVSSELGKKKEAQKYMNQALRYYSGEAEVHYLAAWLNVMNDNYNEAERQCRAAVEINGRHDQSYALLAAVLYAKKNYRDAIDVCDFRIAEDRTRSDAWYLRGMSEYKLERFSDAISTWTNGLTINPDDEVMRSALELLVGDIVPLEDKRRNGWANYHIATAKEYAKRYDAAGQSYEYQRALKVFPSSSVAREAYADMLNLNGFYELYLEQMLFMKNQEGSATSKKRSDLIEGYNSLLENSIAKRWNVEPFYMDKTRWKIGIYTTENSLQFVHADINEITAKMASDIFSGAAVTSVSAETIAVSGFGDAYKRAKGAGFDFFVLLNVNEGLRDITLEYSMYSSRTGTLASKNAFFAAGINRYSNVLCRFRDDVLSHLSVKGKILDRKGTTALIDLGRAERITNGAKFDVVRRGGVLVGDDGKGLFYREADVVATLVVTETGEEISEAELSIRGFYDRVATNDEIVLVSLPTLQKTEEALAAQIAGATAQADAAGKSFVEKQFVILPEDLYVARTPVYVDLIRGIY